MAEAAIRPVLPVIPGNGGFAPINEALAYAIHLQRHRRNLTDAEIIRCIEALDRRRQRGGNHKSQEFKKSKPSNEGIDSGKSASAKETAKVVGVSRSKVERARTVHAKEPVKRVGKLAFASHWHTSRPSFQKNEQLQNWPWCNLPGRTQGKSSPFSL